MGKENSNKKGDNENGNDINDKKDKDFIKLFRSHIDDVARLARENPRAYDLFMLLIKHMDGTNALCVSMAALTEIMGVSRQTISAAVTYLKNNAWIAVLKSGTSNVYIVNPDIAWTSYSNQKQYCKFTTNVLLSSSENAEYLKNREATTHYKKIDDNFIKKVQQNNIDFEERTQQIKQAL